MAVLFESFFIGRGSGRSQIQFDKKEWYRSIVYIEVFGGPLVT